MMEFAEIFKAEMKRAKLTAADIAEISGLSLDYVVKMRQGKRFPQDTGKVKKMIEALGCTEEILQKLLMLYNKGRLGESEWNCMLEVKKMLEYEKEQESFESAAVEIKTLGELQRVEVLKTENEVYDFLQQMLEHNIQTSENSGNSVLQIESGKLPKRMLNLLADYMRRTKCVCEHIFSLKKRNTTEGNLYNLRLVNDIMPLIQSGGHYIPYYDYEEDGERLLGNWILGDGWSIGLNREMGSGIVIWNQEKNGYLKMTFDKKKKDKRQLLKYSHDLVEWMIEFYENHKRYMEEEEHTLLRGENAKFYYLEATPCILYLLPNDMIEQHVVLEGEQKYFLMDRLFKRNAQIYQEKRTHFFTKEGLNKIVKEGRLSGIPEFVYSPLTIEERIYILNVFKDWIQTHEIEYLMLDSKQMKMTPNVSVFTTLSLAQNEISFCMTVADSIYCAICEPGIEEKVSKFCHLMESGVFVHSNQKNIEVLDDLITQLNKKINNILDADFEDIKSENLRLSFFPRFIKMVRVVQLNSSVFSLMEA